MSRERYRDGRHLSRQGGRRRRDPGRPRGVSLPEQRGAVVRGDEAGGVGLALDPGGTGRAGGRARHRIRRMTGFWAWRDSIIRQPGREGAPMIVKWALSWLTLRWTRYR